MKRFFAKIGAGFIQTIKAIDHIGDFLKILPGGEKIVAIIPIIGPALLIALDAVDRAERVLSAPKSGTAKMAMALEEVQAKLKNLNIEEKRVRGLIELALLILKNEAILASIKD